MLEKVTTPASNTVAVAGRDPLELSPSQAKAYGDLLATLDVAPIVVLSGISGSGKTLLLQKLAQDLGAVFLSADDLVRAAMSRDIRGCGDSILMAIEQAFELSDVVILDHGGIALSTYTFQGNSAPFALEMIRQWRRTNGSKRFVMSSSDMRWNGLSNVRSRYHEVTIPEFGAEDYETFLSVGLPPEALQNVDVDLVWRQATALNGHRLHALSAMIGSLPSITTEAVIDLVERDFVTANVRTQEVEALSFADLPGTEALAAKLETHVMLPLEEPELARRLSLKPKRGVLIYGPPGTGKTSIGRALAHRMQGRFFLIDGSIRTEPPGEFFGAVKAIVQQARENAPAVLFVDDADVLFGIEHIAGFSRYLLSLLDGVESEGAGQVCLMMTAMNAGRIPGSVLRSGRVELWLETGVPDYGTRSAILERWIAEIMAEVSVERGDCSRLAALTTGFTPADLRRVVTDARSLYAMDRIARRTIHSIALYIEQAIGNLVRLREKMADNLSDDSLRIQSLSGALAQKPAKYGAGVGGLVEWHASNTVTNVW